MAITGGAIASYKLIDSEPKFAQVIGVEAVTKTVRTPREVCRDEVVKQQAPTRRQSVNISSAGTLVADGTARECSAGCGGAMNEVSEA